jgi:hypothetical protein
MSITEQLEIEEVELGLSDEESVEAELMVVSPDAQLMSEGYVNAVEEQGATVSLQKLLSELEVQQSNYKTAVSEERKKFKTNITDPLATLRSSIIKAHRCLDQLATLTQQRENLRMRTAKLKTRAVQLQNYATPHDIIPLPAHQRTEGKFSTVGPAQ